MATSKIKHYPSMSWSAVTANENYITTANNHIETEKWGRVCMISGYFNNTVEIPAYTTFFSLPSDRIPFIAFSLRTLNDDENYWIFGDTAGNAASQGKRIPVGTHYVTAFYMTSY